MSRATQAHARIEPIPILMHGHHFLASGAFRKKMGDDGSQIVLDIPDISALAHQAFKFKKFVVIYHVTKTEDVRGLVQALIDMGPQASAKTCQIILIAGSHFHALSAVLTKFPAIEVVKNDIEVVDLCKKVRSKFIQLSGPPSPPRGQSILDLSKPKSAEGRVSTPNVILIKGQKKEPESSNQKMKFSKSYAATAVEGPRSGGEFTSGKKDEPGELYLAKVSPPDAESSQIKIEPGETKRESLFHPVSNARETISLLSECVSTKTTLAVFNEARSHQVSVRPESYDESLRTLHGMITHGQLGEAMVQGSGREIAGAERLLVNFSLKRCRVFFRSENYEIKKQEIKIHIPDVIYDVQRRAQLRLRLDGAQSVLVDRLEARGVLLSEEYRVHDLSSDGICVIVSGKQLDLWKSEQKAEQSKIERMRLTIAGREIEARQIHVRHISPSPAQADCFLVGVQFKIISNRDRCFINMFVYRESMDYLDRVMKGA